MLANNTAVKVAKIILFPILLSVANHIRPGSQHLLQGILFIAFWGTWFRTNEGWPFAEKYGKYFNWIGLLAIINGLVFFLCP